MITGDELVVPHTEFISASDYTAAWLVRQRGRARHRIVTLMNLSDFALLPHTIEAKDE